jgi:hypothetical protein
MRVTDHIKYTTAVSIILLPFWNVREVILFAAGSILIDIDHYLFYIFHFKRLNPRGMFLYYEDWLPRVKDKIPYAGICIFHTLETYLAVAVAAFYLKPLLYLLLGLLFHFILDFISLYRNRCLLKRAYSIIEHFIRAAKHKNKGYPFYDRILSEQEKIRR